MSQMRVISVRKECVISLKEPSGGGERAGTQTVQNIGADIKRYSVSPLRLDLVQNRVWIVEFTSNSGKAVKSSTAFRRRHPHATNKGVAVRPSSRITGV